MELDRNGTEKAKRDIDFSIRKGARSILDSDNDVQKPKGRASPGAAGAKPRTIVEKLKAEGKHGK
ncbi:hypothetical protein [Roseimaritima ulvae]|uniref:hypothetical protein n=1 Tax=Roseimaritima ulvae TaxID=980254 RepID=UPI00082D8D57|nr:hypothetical protein [Roseimaritima ulvae]